MIGGFPMLTKGINDISWTGNVTKVELQKRTAYLQECVMTNKRNPRICIFEKNTPKNIVLQKTSKM